MARLNHMETAQWREAWMETNIGRTDHTTSTTPHLKSIEWDELKDRRLCRRPDFFQAMHLD